MTIFGHYVILFIIFSFTRVQVAIEQAILDLQKSSMITTLVGANWYMGMNWSSTINSDLKIKGAIRKLKNNKAPGIDNITGELLEAEIDTAAKWLKIYDEIWEAEQTPREWAKGLLRTLLKKGDLTKCENWRGITLISIPVFCLA